MVTDEMKDILEECLKRNQEQEIDIEEAVSKDIAEEIGTAELSQVSKKEQKPTIWTKQMRDVFGYKMKPFKRESKKIRRNEKCPCNSGLKYKHCCLDKDKLNAFKEAA